MERSAGGVVFYWSKSGEPLYLLMSNPHGTWEFPKGHVMKGESDEEAALREVKEETGLKRLKIIKGFNCTIKYTFRRNGRLIKKTVKYFLMETRPGSIMLSDEHIAFMWLPYEEAIKRLNYKNARRVLSEANSFLLAYRGVWRQ